MISTFGAFAGSRLTSFVGEYTACAIVGPALLPEGVGKGQALLSQRQGWQEQ
jgi:hypothetical protein